MRLYILGNARKQGVQEEADRLLPLLKGSCEIVAFDLHQEQDLSSQSADMAIVFGGDGAILRAARQMGSHQTPVLGVNLGKLGFLADLSPEELHACLPQVLRGEYRVTRHLMLECLAREKSYLGLNEVTIQAGAPFHMIDLDLLVDGEIVSTFSGDGMILSTPIGSTAHNLAAGGPILEQELLAFAITPICPHSLTSRPVVGSADKVYTIAVRRAGAGTALIVDGKDIIPLRENDRVVVRRAPITFGLVKVLGRSYYQTLHDKLLWGTPPHYRAEP